MRLLRVGEDGATEAEAAHAGPAELQLADVDESSFNLLLLIPVIGGALLVLALLVWLLVRCRGRHRAKSNEELSYSAPPMETQQQDVNPRVPERSRPLTSPAALDSSFSRLQDEDVGLANSSLWLSGSGRTVRSGSGKSTGSGPGPPPASDYALAPAQRDQLFNILNHDPALATRRLAVDKIAFERVVGQSATRQLWLCQFEGEEIVVKRLLVASSGDGNNTSTNDAVFPALLSFAHEIQLAAALEHPNIVRFLGVAWGASLRSLCFVSEFLVRGDLSTFLRKARHRRLQTQHHTSSSSLSDASSCTSAPVVTTSSPRSSARPGALTEFTNSGSGFQIASWERDRLPLAAGVARALLHLHSQRPQPVIYRVLRARKVALNDRLEPKLTDFAPAVGGAPPVDQEAMLAGAGDAYWTAPELLAGDAAHTQASDIYAFGVLLSELDTDGQRPYHGVRDSRPGDKLRAFQVLNLVASGDLRPQLGASCPAPVRELAAVCMHQDPKQRPSACEVLQRLKESVRDPEEVRSNRGR